MVNPNKINTELSDYSTKDDTNKISKNSTKSYSNIKFKHKRKLNMIKDNDLQVPSRKSYDCQKDNSLIATLYLCMLLYAHCKNTNLIQIIMRYYMSVQNMLKCHIKVFHQLSFSISSEIVH